MAKANPTFEGRKDETTKPHDPASSPAVETPKEELSTTETTSMTPEETFDHVVTQVDLDTNPDLVTEGVKVGETIQIPVKDTAPDDSEGAE